MAFTLFPERFLSRDLHGVRLITGNRVEELSRNCDSDAKLALNIWQEKIKQSYLGDPLWGKIDQGERYTSELKIYKTPRGLLLDIDCEGKGSFEYTPEGIGVYWQEGGTGAAHYFQTIGLSLWLELQGIPCIHANGLAVKDLAIGIIAPSRTGKTTLSAALAEQGLSVMSDDMMALHRSGDQWQVYPGWPQLRMWPDIAEQYAEEGLGLLEKVHSRFEKRVVDFEADSGSMFCSHSKPLKQLYMLERREGESGGIDVQSISSGEALLHLLQNSMLGDAYRVLGIEQLRLKTLAGLLGGMTLHKISYPSGLNNLPDVCEQLVAHLRR